MVVEKVVSTVNHTKVTCHQVHHMITPLLLLLVDLLDPLFMAVTPQLEGAWVIMAEPDHPNHRRLHKHLVLGPMMHLAVVLILQVSTTMHHKAANLALVMT